MNSHRLDRRGGTRTSRTNPFQSRWYDRLVEQLTETLGAAIFSHEFARGAHLSVDQALQLALDAIDQSP